MKKLQAYKVSPLFFYYAVLLDEEEKVANAFWADPRVRINYGQFGEYRLK